ncbi:MAG: hypothetical protein QHJ82_00015 [Verrucomicrobiota bacterium]|nr:hypothetical protein [Verrucomicrobiota bacterium]
MRTTAFLITTVLALSVSAGLANAQSAREKAKQRLDGAAYAHFEKEIKDRYPKEIAAYGIVEATVTRVMPDVYCPKRGPLCGPNPACKHEKVSVQALDLKVDRVLFTTGPFQWPEEFQRYPAYRQGSFTQGQKLQMSVYGYRTGSTGIGSIRRLTSAPGQDTGK